MSDPLPHRRAAARIEEHPDLDSVEIALPDITYRALQAGNGAPLLLLHGFTGSTRSWESLIPAFASRYGVIAIDQIGHGGTDAPENFERYSMEHVVGDLLALLDHLAPRRPVRVLGYSMGGRVALALAATAPERVAALVLESASPGIEDPRERALRATSDRDLAERIRRDGLEAFIRSWEDSPLFASQRRLPPDVLARQRALRLSNSAIGLANSLLGMGSGVQAPLYDRLPTLQMPVLVIAGALDVKYRSLAETMARRISTSRAMVIPDCGHAVHLEQPTLFATAVLEFLSTTVYQDRGVQTL